MRRLGTSLMEHPSGKAELQFGRFFNFLGTPWERRTLVRPDKAEMFSRKKASLPGKKSEPRSLDSRQGGNELFWSLLTKPRKGW